MRCCRQTYFFTKQWLHITEYNSAQCTSGRLCKPSHVWKLMEHWLGRKKGVYRKACIEWCAKCKRHRTDIKFYKWWQQDHAYFFTVPKQNCSEMVSHGMRSVPTQGHEKRSGQICRRESYPSTFFFSFYEQHHGWLGKIQNVPLGDLMGIQTWHDLSKSVVGPSGTLCSVVSVVIQ